MPYPFKNTMWLTIFIHFPWLNPGFLTAANVATTTRKGHQHDPHRVALQVLCTWWATWLTESQWPSDSAVGGLAAQIGTNIIFIYCIYTWCIWYDMIITHIYGIYIYIGIYVLFSDAMWDASFIQGGAPPVISWFIIPINYRYNPINPSYWTYKPT